MLFLFKSIKEFGFIPSDPLLTVTDLQVLLGWTRASDNIRDELDLNLWENRQNNQSEEDETPNQLKLQRRRMTGREKDKTKPKTKR